MRQALCLALALLMMMRLGPAAFGADSATIQIAGIPTGANIEVRLKNKQTLRGTRGEVSSSGFTLVTAGAADRQLAFDDVTSVKLNRKSHTKRNVLIVAGVAVVAVTVAVVIYAKSCPLGCNTHY
jgi:hypothetical protein